MMGNIFYLCGFMASGKSTIGPILANTLGCKFIDLDEKIEEREKKRITQIFSDKGEDYFRQTETELLLEIAIGERLIISLGGGTLIKPENRDFIMSTGKLIFLKTSPRIAFERLKYKKDRPVLINKEDDEVDEETYIKRIEELMNERKDFYSIADFTFNTDNDSVGKTVDKIARVIRNSINQ